MSQKAAMRRRRQAVLKTKRFRRAKGIKPHLQALWERKAQQSVSQYQARK